MKKKEETTDDDDFDIKAEQYEFDCLKIELPEIEKRSIFRRILKYITFKKNKKWGE